MSNLCMAIKTKSIFKPAEAEDGLRILITRFYPQGIKKEHFDLWLRELSPSIDLLLSYKHGVRSWQEFKSIFVSELRNNIDSLEALQALNNEAMRTNVTLLCYEKEGQPCHRHLVRDMIEFPQLIRGDFVPKDTNNHECISMDGLIPDKESLSPFGIIKS